MKPLPRITDLSRPYWEGCAAGDLRLQRCLGCGNYRFFPSEACHSCGHPSFEWEPVTPRATVYSWIVVHRPVDEYWADDVPFAIVVGQMDLPGRPLLTGTLSHPDGEWGLATIEAGMPLRASFQRVTDEVHLLVWHPG